MIIIEFNNNQTKPMELKNLKSTDKYENCFVMVWACVSA